MVRNESVLIEMIFLAEIVIFLLILSPQIGVSEENNIDPDVGQYELVQQSPDINAHQGITTDETYFYLFHTDFIKKVDKNWNEIDINRNVFSEIGGGINHLGDGDYHNGKLYIPVEYWDNHNNFRSQHIAIWDASDLSYIGKYDISAQGHEVAGVTVSNDQVFVVSFYDSKI
ncbi:MAG: hypothetical protein KAI71_00700 [Candidatus Pacebacteria bacterium]|nr:hypothetical protein [Candidatus Paceibacterota bacterium]